MATSPRRSARGSCSTWTSATSARSWQGDPGFVLADEPATVRGPDVAFVAKGRDPALRAGFAQSSPDLAIEIVSPSDAYTRLQEKGA